MKVGEGSGRGGFWGRLGKEDIAQHAEPTSVICLHFVPLFISPSLLSSPLLLSSPPVLQTFVDNFQTAKAALAEVTAQAAEKAAVGVRELAERSSRISLEVHINAPVLFLPQSSSSTNVIAADLGRIVVSNDFAVEAADSPLRTAIPPITDNMKVELSHLKMYRSEFRVQSSGWDLYGRVSQCC